VYKQLTLMVLALLIALCVRWYNTPIYIQKNDCDILDIVSPKDLKAMEKACTKMGPLYQYTVDPDGTLKVNTGDGNCMKLNYKINSD
jgi:secreted protein with Ig-like and vWFA domain